MRLDASILRRFTLGVTFMFSASCQNIMPSAPESSFDITLPSGTTNQQVFQCAEKVIDQLGEGGTLWRRNVTLRDIEGGLFETGNFPQDNVMGYRFRLIISASSPKSLSATVKASGPSQADIGAEDAMSKFLAGFNACLAGTPQ